MIRPKQVLINPLTEKYRNALSIPRASEYKLNFWISW